MQQIRLTKKQAKELANFAGAKQGQAVNAIQSLSVVAVLLVIAIVVMTIGGQVVNEVKKTQAVNSTAENISQAGLASLNKFGDFMPIVAIVTIAGVIIAILVGSFAMRRT